MLSALMIARIHDQVDELVAREILEALAAPVQFLVHLDTRLPELLVGVFGAEADVEILSAREPDVAVGIVQAKAKDTRALSS
jgi:hypothetical protein